MNDENVLITNVVIITPNDMISTKPEKVFYVNPNQEPWPEKWEIIYNVYAGNMLKITQ